MASELYPNHSGLGIGIDTFGFVTNHLFGFNGSNGRMDVHALAITIAIQVKIFAPTNPSPFQEDFGIAIDRVVLQRQA